MSRVNLVDKNLQFFGLQFHLGTSTSCIVVVAEIKLRNKDVFLKLPPQIPNNLPFQFEIGAYAHLDNTPVYGVNGD